MAREWHASRPLWGTAGKRESSRGASRSACALASAKLGARCAPGLVRVVRGRAPVDDLKALVDCRLLLPLHLVFCSSGHGWDQVVHSYTQLLVVICATLLSAAGVTGARRRRTRTISLRRRAQSFVGSGSVVCNRGACDAWHCGFIPTRGDSGRRSNGTTSPPGPLDLPSRSRLRAAALPLPPAKFAKPIFARRQCLEAAPPPATLSGLVAAAPRRMLWCGGRYGEPPTTTTRPQRGARKASPC